MQSLISLQSDNLKFTGVEIHNPHHVDIPAGISVLIGPNGCGKTSLAKILEGGWNFMTNCISSPKGRLKVQRVEFCDIHSLAAGKGEYYQQRFESTFNDDVPTVADVLGSRLQTPEWTSIADTLGIEYLTRRRLNFLSSGELRKVLVANMMCESPDLLVLDNPYIGLDAPSRQVLDCALQSMQKKGISVMLLIGNPAEIPDFVGVGIPMTNMTIGKPIIKSDDERAVDFRQRFSSLFESGSGDTPIYPEAAELHTATAEEIVKLKHCQVKYGRHILLDDVSWTIRQGECWSLSGPNGSGKSTLLSLINADNPQGYSNDICLFGRRRGTGESIWDIKRRIGYISPEKHLYFNSLNATTLDVVAGGMMEAIDQYRHLTSQEMAKAIDWLRQLGISHLADRRFSLLSFGQQRLALLARTLIKNAPLLILDEPLHGLDVANKRKVNSIINRIVSNHNTTLIYVTHYEDEIPACVTHSMRLQPKVRD